MNASKKRNENALNMKHDYAFFSVQGQFIVPILDVLRNVLDWESFSEPPGRCLNSYYALNRSRMWFSELSFLTKFQVLFSWFLSSCVSNGTRVVILAYVVMN